MLVFSDETGAAGALARDLHGRLERLGVYEPEAASLAAAPHRRAVPRAAAPLAAAGRALRTYVRPALLFTYPYCGPQAPSTSSSRNMH